MVALGLLLESGLDSYIAIVSKRSEMFVLNLLGGSYCRTDFGDICPICAMVCVFGSHRHWTIFFFLLPELELESVLDLEVAGPFFEDCFL